MVWAGVLWHLVALGLGAFADLSPATPAALAAGVAVALLAIALIRRAPADVPAHRATAPIRPPRHTAPLMVRATDPDAPGRARPRAPSSAA